MKDNPKELTSIAAIEPPEIPPAASEPTRAQLKIIQAAAALKADPDTGTPVFMPRFLVQCTLPHQDPGNVPVWQRHNNEFTLSLQPGYDIDGECIGYPYGLIPRLLLIWMVTEAKRTANRRLSLGSNYSTFLATLGLEPKGRGKRSDAKRFKEQTRRLLNTRIMFHKRISKTVASEGKLYLIEGEGMEDRQIASSYELWWNISGDEHHHELWESFVELGPDFFAAIMESVVPFKLEAVAVLGRSALAIDLYILCVYLGYYLSLKGLSKHMLTWHMLNQQLGAAYEDMDNLKKAVISVLPQIKLAHPGLRLQVKKGKTATKKNGIVRGGIEIYASAPAVKPRIPMNLEVR